MMKYTVRKCLRIIEMHGRDNIARRQRQEISGITFRAMNLLKKNNDSSLEFSMLKTSRSNLLKVTVSVALCRKPSC